MQLPDSAAALLPANTTYPWWGSVVFLAGAHAAFSIRFARSHSAVVPGWALFCYVAFCVGALYRSTFPINWSARPHWCLWETPLRIVGGDMADRLVAQTAEVSLGCITAFTSGVHLDKLKRPRTALAARLLSWPIVVAQMSCWVGEITDNKLYHVIEESLWGCTYALHFALAALATLAVREQAPSMAKTYLFWLAVGCVPYVYFMAAVDVPMYYAQWQADEAKGVVYDGWGPGLYRMLTCQVVSDDWEGWKEDAQWQCLYFGVAPFVAYGMANSLKGKPKRGAAAKPAGASPPLALRKPSRRAASPAKKKA